MSADALVVTGVGAVTPWGHDPSRLDLDGGPPPDPHGPWFDVAAELGPRGYKYVPVSCRHLLAATRRALTDAAPDARAGTAPHQP